MGLPAKTETGAHRLLVVGCGNPLASDDSAGIEVIEQLQRRRQFLAELRAVPFPGVELLDLFAQADVLLFIDAVLSGELPGTIHLLPLPFPGVEPKSLTSCSTHGWGLAASIELARALGRPTPRLVLLGIELSVSSQGFERSQAVGHAVREIVENFALLRSWVLDRHEWFPPLRFSPGDMAAALRASRPSSASA